MLNKTKMLLAVAVATMIMMASTSGVSTAIAALPEPVIWLVMIIVIGAIGSAMRSAKRRSDEKFDAKIKRITNGAIA